MTEIETHDYDVVVIGAGGAGLRAAIAARELGKRTAVVCKSLFGKAHTVMAEGGIAASMGNVNSRDSWQVHFRDTMRGGKFLNNWRMAELHAKEAPQRVWELETYGALFDRTKDGKISQRNFGGHTYARLAHVGDRTGLELIRSLQQKIVSLQQEDHAELGDYEARIRVFAECTITELLKDGDAIAGAFGYWRETGRFLLFEAPAVVMATGGIGKSFKVTSNSWEYTGDGHALALRAGATLINMEFVQFHPTGMVWPPSVKGILVTEGVRGDGGVLKNSENSRFMFDYIPPVFKGQYAETEQEADQWLKDNDSARRTPDLLPRDEVARAINSEVKAGRGSPHGGVYLDIASRLTPVEIKRRLPSMYHQFMELAEVDITKDAMEVGPTCHYVMGGIPTTITGQVLRDNTARVPGLYAAGECACVSVHGANRLGTNSLLDINVFGRRAGIAAANYALGHDFVALPPEPAAMVVGWVGNILSEHGNERVADIRGALQQSMDNNAAVFRTEETLKQALTDIHALKERYSRITVHDKGRRFNSDLLEAIELGFLLELAEVTVVGALNRKESRGGHAREDYPNRDDTNYMRHTMAYKVLEGSSAAIGESTEASDLLSDIRLDFKPVVQTRYEPKERKY
ncbi:MAG: fumarate reductase/succinate dehydrogenase flavoprotein subunit [Pseudonocardiaceae bacterium]